MKIRIFILLSFLGAFAACNERDIPTFSGGNYIQFNNSYKDSMEISFVFYPGKSSLEIPVKMKLLGNLLDADGSYEIEIIQAGTTALASDYSIPQGLTLKKGEVYGEFNLTINHPGNRSVRLVLGVKNGGTIGAGQTEYTRKIVWFNNKISKPLWWDSSVESSFLGPYTDTKFLLLIEVNQSGDWTDYTPDQKMAAARKLKYYLREMETAGTPIQDENGLNMTVPVIG